MRRLNVFESISVDGFFSDGGADVSWAHASDDAELASWVAGNASGGGELVTLFSDRRALRLVDERRFDCCNVVVTYAA